MKKYLVVLLSFFFFATFATPFLLSAESDCGRKIQSISQKGDIATITLSDGLVFKGKLKNYPKEVLMDWKEGDTIDIGVTIRHPRFYLSNADIGYLSHFRVFLTKKSIQRLSTIEKIDVLEGEYADDYLDLYVTLSDGSCWKIRHKNREDKLLNYWNSGDRIIINPYGDSVAHIINVSVAVTDDWAFSEELVSLKK
ncbi:MAG: hypothetical protein ACHQUC_09890, partial [Chlamydiales bacterium]